MKPLLEQFVRSDLTKRYCGWLNTVQPAPGGSDGFPDTIINPHDPRFIEIKRGAVDNLRLYTDKIRPDQISWHTRFRAEGGRSWFYVGAMDSHGVLRRYIVEAPTLIALRLEGVPLSCKAVQLIGVSHQTAKPDSAFTNNLLSATQRF